MKHKARAGVRPAPLYYGNTPANKRPINQTLLHTWLKQHGISRNGFARMVGCNPKMVDYWSDGRCIPNLIYAFQIEAVTEGGVSADSWLGTEAGRLAWAGVQENAKRNA